MKITRLRAQLRSNLLEDWPDSPFAVIIPTSSPNEHCHLQFTTVGDLISPGLETNLLLIDIVEQTRYFFGKPDGSIPYEFDISNDGYRFKLEPVPQHPLDKEMALGALDILHHLVSTDKAVEFRALIACNNIALGRLSVHFPTELEIPKNTTMPRNATAIR